MNEGSSSSITTIRLGGGRAIDRFNPIIRDTSRIGKLCQNNIISSSSSENTTQAKVSTNRKKKHVSSSSKQYSPKISTGCVSSATKQIKIVDKSTNVAKTTSDHGHDTYKKKNTNDGLIKRRSLLSCTNPGEFFSPPGSSRYLLTSNYQKSSTINSPDFDPLLPPPPPLLLPAPKLKHDDDGPSPSSQPTRSSRQVVVVLRVSLHCRGCERKMRKHLSRMEGVTSFDIDFAAKKLTVVGDVTPLELLASVSKVKNAQLLTLPPSSVCSEVKKDMVEVV